MLCIMLYIWIHTCLLEFLSIWNNVYFQWKYTLYRIEIFKTQFLFVDYTYVLCIGKYSQSSFEMIRNS